MREINKIILHCSATKEGSHFTVKDIDAWHKNRGWSGVGYHYVILLDGTVQKGRDISKIGAHVRGHNAKSIGICYIGGLDKDGKAKDTRTEAQIEAMNKLIKWLNHKFPEASIHGHNEFSNKACPCFNVKEEYSKEAKIWGSDMIDDKPKVAEIAKSPSAIAAATAAVAGTSAMIKELQDISASLQETSSSMGEVLNAASSQYWLMPALLGLAIGGAIVVIARKIYHVFGKRGR